MSIAKYSPARVDKPMVDFIDGIPVDDEGYDAYGYHAITERDRDGFSEEDYLVDPEF